MQAGCRSVQDLPPGIVDHPLQQTFAAAQSAGRALRLLKCYFSYRADFIEVSIGYCGEKGPRSSPRSADPDVTLQNLPKDRASSTAAGPIVPESEDGFGPGVQDLARLLYLSAGITKQRAYPGGEIYFRAAA